MRIHSLIVHQSSNWLDWVSPFDLVQRAMIETVWMMMDIVIKSKLSLLVSYYYYYYIFYLYKREKESSDWEIGGESVSAMVTLHLLNVAIGGQLLGPMTFKSASQWCSFSLWHSPWSYLWIHSLVLAHSLSLSLSIVFSRRVAPSCQMATSEMKITKAHLFCWSLVYNPTATTRLFSSIHLASKTN